ncbi:MAG: NAD-dependent epimerase/dehydratase family protein, partial [Halanaeroarchaeum sp.]
VIFEDGRQTRDFVHVSDIVRANLRAAATTHVGEAYNVGTGNAITIERLARLVREATGADSPIEFVDPRQGDIRLSRADTSAARERFGFEASVDLEAGLRTIL